MKKILLTGALLTVCAITTTAFSKELPGTSVIRPIPNPVTLTLDCGQNDIVVIQTGGGAAQAVTTKMPINWLPRQHTCRFDARSTTRGYEYIGLGKAVEPFCHIVKDGLTFKEQVAWLYGICTTTPYPLPPYQVQ
jgi:hypothetical protein